MDPRTFAATNISVNAHSSVRLQCINAAGQELVVYVDPYLMDEDHGIAAPPKDADVVCFTHSHYDHFSPEDVAKVAREDGETTYVMPASMVKDAVEAGIPAGAVVKVAPGETVEVKSIVIRGVRAYNFAKPFHPKTNDWLGYVIEAAPEVAVYICGDTDINPENTQVACDVLCVPVGGTYTMNVPEAAAMVRCMHDAWGENKPSVCIPTHYGSITGTPEDGQQFASLCPEGVEIIIPF